CRELFALEREVWIGANHERPCPRLLKVGKKCIELALVPSAQDMKLQSKPAGRDFRVFQSGFRLRGTSRIHEKRDTQCRRYCSVQQLQSLRYHLLIQGGHAREVATRMVQAQHKSKLDWITADVEHDWNRRCCGLGR